MLSVPVQGFLIWRCWLVRFQIEMLLLYDSILFCHQVTGHNKYLLVRLIHRIIIVLHKSHSIIQFFLLTLALSSAALSIVFTVQRFPIDNTAELLKDVLSGGICE